MKRTQLGTTTFLPLAIVGLIGSAAVGPGCNKDKQADSTSATIVETKATTTLSEDQQIAARALVAKADPKRWSFGEEELNRQENVPLFSHLAATSEEPAVIGASLSALRTVHLSSKRDSLDADTLAAVGRHLSAGDPRLLGRALELARIGASGPQGDTKLIEQLTQLASKHRSGAARYALLNAFSGVVQANRSKATMTVFLETLGSDDPQSVSLALQLLQRAQNSIDDAPGLAQRALELTRHTDAGVRGRALSLLGMIAPRDAAVADAALTALADPAAYVRAEACATLSAVAARWSIHQMMPLLDDGAEALYRLSGFPTLEGSPGRLTHALADGKTVRTVALRAVDTLAGRELALDLRDRDADEATVLANIAAAKAWYQTQKDALPTTRDETPPRPSSATSAAAAAQPAPATTAQQQ